jgi:hypothetical protein
MPTHASCQDPQGRPEAGVGLGDVEAPGPGVEHQPDRTIDRGRGGAGGIWNGLLGLAYSAAFLRHGLEAAVLTHMATHLGFALAAL